MALPSQVVYIIYALVFGIGWWLLGKYAKGVKLVLSSVFLMFLIGSSAFLYYDNSVTQKTLNTGVKRFVFADAGTLHASFDTSTGSVNITEDLELQRVAYAAGDLRQLKGDANVVIVLGRASFDSVGAINLSGTWVSKDQALDMIAGESPRDQYIKLYAIQHDINESGIVPDALGSNAGFKG
ncbi:MAG: hypothetical protein AABY13_04450, partial [Nanoarchaeota archaeon]